MGIMKIGFGENVFELGRRESKSRYSCSNVVQRGEVKFGECVRVCGGHGSLLLTSTIPCWIGAFARAEFTMIPTGTISPMPTISDPLFDISGTRILERSPRSNSLFYPIYTNLSLMFTRWARQVKYQVQMEARRPASFRSCRSGG